MKILGIDPGNRFTGVALYDSELHAVPFFKIFQDDNDGCVGFLRSLCPPFPEMLVDEIIIEGVKSYGQIVGADVFDTCMWIGEFRRVIKDITIPLRMSWRKEYITHITLSPRATDANVRAAVIERWGGKNKAIGSVKCKACGGKGEVGRRHCLICGKNKNKTCCDQEPVKDECLACEGEGWEYPPGPLHGIASHVWPALAMAVFAAEVRSAD
jgi:hypothetical protein